MKLIIQNKATRSILSGLNTILCHRKWWNVSLMCVFSSCGHIAKHIITPLIPSIHQRLRSFTSPYSLYIARQSGIRDQMDSLTNPIINVLPQKKKTHFAFLLNTAYLLNGALSWMVALTLKKPLQTSGKIMVCMAFFVSRFHQNTIMHWLLWNITRIYDFKIVLQKDSSSLWTWQPRGGKRAAKRSQTVFSRELAS